MFDFAELKHWDAVEHSMHGNHKPLMALLLSDEKISRVARDYIAGELGKEPKKRFARQRRRNLDLVEQDKFLFYRVISAKRQILIDSLPATMTEDDRLDILMAKWNDWRTVSDAAALNWLAGKDGPIIDDDMLRNAKSRNENWERMTFP